MGQHGHRNMYYQTGLPGWVRMGYSPGWDGQPPMAQYLQDTGQLEDAQKWFRQNEPQAQNTAQNTAHGAGVQATTAQDQSEGSEKEQLRQKVASLQQQVQDLQAQLDDSE